MIITIISILGTSVLSYFWKRFKAARICQLHSLPKHITAPHHSPPSAASSSPPASGWYHSTNYGQPQKHHAQSTDRSVSKSPSGWESSELPCPAWEKCYCPTQCFYELWWTVPHVDFYEPTSPYRQHHHSCAGSHPAVSLGCAKQCH